MAGAVTIYDVAARAGVSIKSVSRVLNGEANVSPTLKTKVEEAVRALGYRRSLSARALAGARSTLIAALADAELTIEHWKSGRGNDYLSRLELGALIECRKSDFHLMVELVDHGSAGLVRELSALLDSIRPHGVLLTPPNSDHETVLDVLDAAGVPYARIGPERHPGRGFSVSMDDRAAAHELTRHLLNLGHRRIALVAGPDAYFASREREAGFRQALDEAGVGGPVVRAQGDFTFASGLAAVETLLAAGPSAVVAGNDDMALGVLQGSAARGLAIPRDLAVVGFDDTPSALFSTPALTTIRQPVSEMAAAAVRLLIQPPETGVETPAGARLVLPHELIVRESTCPPRA